VQQPVGDCWLECARWRGLHQADIVMSGTGNSPQPGPPSAHIAHMPLRLLSRLLYSWMTSWAGRPAEWEDVGQLWRGAVIHSFLAPSRDLGDYAGVQVGALEVGDGTRRTAPHGWRSGAFQHVGHAVRRTPTCPCRSAPFLGSRKPNMSTSIFIGGEPLDVFIIALQNHRARIHRSVPFIAGAVQETGVDEDRDRGPWRRDGIPSMVEGGAPRPSPPS